MTNKILTFFFAAFLCQNLSSQIDDVNQFRPDPEKEKKFRVYLSVWHGGIDKVEQFKKSNTVLYYKELWYYTESFYIKRDYLAEGVTLDESIIDVSRWESERDEKKEKIVILPGYRDVMVLIPENKLKYKPVR